MKNLFSSFSSLLVAAACALTLGSCNRAEYTMLPQGGSYLGSTRVATPVPAAKTAPVAAEVAVAPAAVRAAVSTESVPTATDVAPASAPATTPGDVATSATAMGNTATVSTPTAPIKMTRVQRFAANKLLKSVAKKIDSKQLSQRLNTAETQKVSSNLKLGIVLMVIGAIVALLPGLFRVLGLIIFIIGVLFLVLAILDMV
jgi:hypothetical protein